MTKHSKRHCVRMGRSHGRKVCKKFAPGRK